MVQASNVPDGSAFIFGSDLIQFEVKQPIHSVRAFVDASRDAVHAGTIKMTIYDADGTPIATVSPRSVPVGKWSQNEARVVSDTPIRYIIFHGLGGGDSLAGLSGGDTIKGGTRGDTLSYDAHGSGTTDTAEVFAPHRPAQAMTADDLVGVQGGDAISAGWRAGARRRR